LFLLTSADNLMTCLDVTTGQKLLEHEFAPDTGDGVFYASPLAIRDDVYALREDGTMIIFTVRQKEETCSYAGVGHGRLKDQTHCWATPAVSNGCLFIRSKTHLYCIAATKSSE